MHSILVRIVVSFGTGLMLVLGLCSAPSWASNAWPVIPKPEAVPAPWGGLGGVMNANTYCTDYEIAPDNVWRFENVATGKKYRYVWTGVYPGYWFPRLPVGRYYSITTSWCDGNKKTVAHYFGVGQKTPKGTVSPSEFRKIRKGMTRGRVTQIVGSDGHHCFLDRGVICRYDQMAFWQWAHIKFHNSRVVWKDWSVGHD